MYLILHLKANGMLKVFYVPIDVYTLEFRLDGREINGGNNM